MVSYLFIADPAKEQRCKKLWIRWVDLTPGIPLFLTGAGLLVVKKVAFATEAGGW